MTKLIDFGKLKNIQPEILFARNKHPLVGGVMKPTANLIINTAAKLISKLLLALFQK